MRRRFSRRRRLFRGRRSFARRRRPMKRIAFGGRRAGFRM